MHIRPFSDRDYESVAEIITLVRPDSPVTAQNLAHYDALREPYLLHGKWVAEEHDRVIGVAMHTQHADLYDPHQLWVMVRVHPAFQRRGIGAALYDALIDRVRRLDVDTLKVQLRADHYPGLNFAARRGFIEYGRRVESLARLGRFDPSAFPDPDTQLAERGLSLRSVRELESDPDRDRKLYNLKWEIEQDIPYPGTVSLPAFEAFQTNVLRAPDFLPDGSFVALDDERYVGLLMHFSGSPQALYVDLTGTANDYRRRGIAQALKVKSMAWAKAAGYQTIRVTNDVANVAMLALNGKLGFERQPAVILLHRRGPF